jgi:hypothetical protein
MLKLSRIRSEINAARQRMASGIALSDDEIKTVADPSMPIAQGSGGGVESYVHDATGKLVAAPKE